MRAILLVLALAACTPKPAPVTLMGKAAGQAASVQAPPPVHLSGTATAAARAGTR